MRVALILLSCCGLMAQVYDIIHLGVYTTETPSQAFRRYHDLTRAVAKTLQGEGMRGDVKLRIFENEAESIDQLRKGKIDFAPLHPVTYLELRRELPEIEVFAGEVKRDSFIEYGNIITPKTVSVRSLTHLKGRGFAFGPEGDPLLDWAARAQLARAGLSAAQVKTKYLELDRIEELVTVGRYQAGVIRGQVAESEDYPFRVLAEVKAPNRVWIMQASLLPYLKQRIHDTILQLDAGMLGRMGIKAIEEISSEDLNFFDPVVEDAKAF